MYKYSRVAPGGDEHGASLVLRGIRQPPTTGRQLRWASRIVKHIDAIGQSAAGPEPPPLDLPLIIENTALLIGGPTLVETPRAPSAPKIATWGVQSEH